MEIIFENGEFLVINKPAGLVVNSSKTINEETLQDQLGLYFGLKKGELGIGERAGIVHRLDRETSGVIVVAKSEAVFGALQEEFKNRGVKKEYLALVHGRVANKFGVVNAKIARVGKFGKFGIAPGGRESETVYERISNYGFGGSNFENFSSNLGLSRMRIKYLQKHAVDYSLLSVFPKTGRTHQIRVHLKSVGHPVVSDKIYCPSKLLKFDLEWCPRLFLHSKKIEFELGRKRFVFKALLPYDLEEAIKNLNKLPNERSK